MRKIKYGSAKSWEKNSPKALWKLLKYRAKQKGFENIIESQDFEDWWNKQKPECIYCHLNVRNKRSLQVDRKDNRIGYSEENIVLACFRCNRVKSDVFTFEQMLEIAGKYF
jgi:hypothetical protein